MKKFTAAALLGISCMGAWAAPLSPQQALERVFKDSPRKVSSMVSTKLCLTEEIDGVPALYLFSRGENGGFMLVSADDSTVPLLGYGDASVGDDAANGLPPAFRCWMRGLADQVAANAAGGLTFNTPAPVGEEIAPMTTTRWNQDAPYNNDCPKVGDRHCYTGCVATAMSQILKYHNYPPTGTGKHEYKWRNPATDADTLLSFDFAATTFDWDNMLNRYDREDSEASKAAVATLMHAAGVAVNMGYGTDESGAPTVLIAPAMLNYFGYDKGIRSYHRDYYGIDEWNQLVYDQLKTYGPVQYSGYSNQDGHSFVCDGYDGDGYFHINWGWGGMSDGYFLLTALDPGAQGIGGSESGFNFGQVFVGNVSTQQTSDHIYEQMLMTGAFTCNVAKTTLGKDVTFSGGEYNYSSATIPELMAGVKLTPADGGDPVYLHGPEYKDMGIVYGIDRYDVRLPEDLKEGSYVVTPVFRNSQGVWQVVPVPVGLRSSYTMTVEGKEVTFSPGERASVAVTGFRNLTPFYIGCNFEVEATITNSSDKEYYQQLCVVLSPSSGDMKVIAKAERVAVDVTAGETYDFKYLSQFENSDSTLSPGVYDVYLCEENGSTYKPLSKALRIELFADATPELKLTGFSISERQSKDDIEAEASVECVSGWYYGTLRLGIIDRDDRDRRVVRWIESGTVTLQAADSTVVSGVTDFPAVATVKFRGAFPQAEEGKTYDVAVYENKKMLSDLRKIIIDESVGVDNVAKEAAPVKSEYFTLTGNSLGSRTPRTGIYIVRNTYPDGTVKTLRAVVK